MLRTCTGCNLTHLFESLRQRSTAPNKQHTEIVAWLVCAEPTGSFSFVLRPNLPSQCTRALVFMRSRARRHRRSGVACRPSELLLPSLVETVRWDRLAFNSALLAPLLSLLDQVARPYLAWRIAQRLTERRLLKRALVPEVLLEVAV